MDDGRTTVVTLVNVYLLNQNSLKIKIRISSLSICCIPSFQPLCSGDRGNELIDQRLPGSRWQYRKYILSPKQPFPRLHLLLRGILNFWEEFCQGNTYAAFKVNIELIGSHFGNSLVSLFASLTSFTRSRPSSRPLALIGREDTKEVACLQSIFPFPPFFFFLFFFFKFIFQKIP